jgi:5-methylcytosine-specific restriction endonuclease McrA
MKKVLERDGWRCRKCGSLENLQVHHKIRRSQQGNDNLDNLATLCAYCHTAEHGQLYCNGPAISMASSFLHRREES